MKKLFYGLITILLFNQYSHAQSMNAPTLTMDDAQIIAINKMVDEIKSGMNTFKKVEKVKNKTGYNHGYFKDGGLQLIRAYYKDTITEKNVDWYFKKGQLVFSMKVWTDVKTKDTLDYERFFLSNERLIAWFKFDQSVDRSKEGFRKVSAKMRDYIGDLKLEYVK